MDRISNLPEDLLLNILSSLPIKDVIATMLLSKSWKFLWTMVPKLDFDDNVHQYFGEDGVEYRVFQEFVNRVLVSNTAPVLETLKLKLGCPLSSTDDITTWITTAISRRVRELEIHRSLKGDGAYLFKLPQCLYTSEKLVVLKLYKSILLDVPVEVSLPSLKSLYLVSVIYIDEESHRRLLTACPVLEELVIDKSENYPVALSLSVVIPSLQRLSIVDALQFRSSVKRDTWYENKVVINVPSLKYLSYVDIYDYGHVCSSENMPELVEANVKLICKRPEELMRSITSVKCLSLCLYGSILLQHRIEFYQLVHLELCGCSPYWWDLYTWMLENSPKLQVLKLNNCKEWFNHFANPIFGRWRQPSSVPECLMCHLSTFEWKYYSGGREAKRVVAYILKNARQLKTVDIASPKLCQRKTKTGQIKELASLPRASSSCQLFLDDKRIY
ncbi:putative FBD-associated F-box protein [Cardamine amara subsp. amara]|uniref:FBD-associated F-box protein n=1 Tax=Cardamine amara subsp. amara TaxID=228776 RepID=A0ABD1B2Z8_CARAN